MTNPDFSSCGHWGKKLLMCDWGFSLESFYSSQFGKGVTPIYTILHLITIYGKVLIETGIAPSSLI
jgi:hypothetical protein